MPIDDDAEQRYGSFIATQDADSKTELDVEQKLLQTTGIIYMSPDLQQAKYAAIGTLEYTRNFLLKYADSLPNDGEILREIDSNITVIRLSSQIDREILNQIFQNMRSKIIPILGKNLGFRKRRVMSYKWTEKMQSRIQIPDSPELQKIINKKKTDLRRLPKSSITQLNNTTETQ